MGPELNSLSPMYSAIPSHFSVIYTTYGENQKYHALGLLFYHNQVLNWKANTLKLEKTNHLWNLNIYC